MFELPRSVLRLFRSYPRFESSALPTMPSMQMYVRCKVTSLLVGNSGAVTVEYTRPCYSEDTNSYIALLNFKTFMHF